VTLVAVSKSQPAEKIREAFVAGCGHFGENYVQEAVAKMDVLADLPITWLLAMAGGYYAWRVLRRDLLMLSAGSLAAIVVATAAFARMLGSFADSLGVLIALMVVGLSAWAAHWIRSIAKLPEGQ